MKTKYQSTQQTLLWDGSEIEKPFYIKQYETLSHKGGLNVSRNFSR